MRILCGPEGVEGGGGAAVADTGADEGADAIIESQDANGNVDSGADEIDGSQADEGAGEQQIEQTGPRQATTELLRRAVRAGLEDDEIAAYESDADALERAINLVSRRSQQQKDSGQQNQQQADEIKVEDIPDLDPEEATEKVIAGWKAMKGMIGRLQQQISGVRGGMSQQQVAAEHNWFDSQLGALTNAEQLFGKGTADEVDRQSPQFANRSKLWDAQARIRSGYASRGEKMPARGELLKQAYRLAFGDQIAKATTAALQKNLRTQATQFTVPPTQRKIASEDPKKRAVSNVSGTMKKKGLLR